MEVVDEVVLINQTELLFALYTVLWRFPKDICETNGISRFHTWCADEGLLPSDAAADLRGTLYWHPSISLAAGGRMEVEVKTPSYPGTFRVVAEGVTSEGKPFRTETTLTVSR